MHVERDVLQQTLAAQAPKQHAPAAPSTPVKEKTEVIADLRVDRFRAVSERLLALFIHEPSLLDRFSGNFDPSVLNIYNIIIIYNILYL